MSKGDQAYSNQYRPCVFFCINDGEGAVEGVNKNTKYSKKIIIKSITDEQLDEMKIRRCDEAVHYLKDFNLNEMEYEWEDVVVEKKLIGFNLKGIFNVKDEYTKAFWISMIPFSLSIAFSGILIVIGFSILK